MHTLSDLAGKRVIFLASTGGHLSQAAKWYHRLGVSPDSLFITFDSPQSESILLNRNKFLIPYIAPRDFIALSRGIFEVLRNKDLRHIDAVVSTGAGIAFIGLALRYIRGLHFFYIESVSRYNAPSLTGRILEKMPMVKLHSQHRYANSRWTPVRPLIEDYAITHASEDVIDRPLNVLVTLGTIKPYRFDRLVDLVLPLLRTDDAVTWQLGVTERTGLPGEVFDLIKAAEFNQLVREADLIITHAGVGTLMALLDAGKKPIVLARDPKFSEHVDGHQRQVLSHLKRHTLIEELSEGLTRAELLVIANTVITTPSADGPA